jgi:hypothetical protein
LTLLQSPHDNSRSIKEQAAKLIHAITLDYAGRNYVLSSSFALKIVLKAAISEDKDTLLRQNLLGALQKLSTRYVVSSHDRFTPISSRKVQSELIHLQAIPYLIQLLHDEKFDLSDESAEFATCLLMNLCLRTAGKKQCLKDSANIIKVLTELMEHEQLQVSFLKNQA